MTARLRRRAGPRLCGLGLLLLLTVLVASPAMPQTPGTPAQPEGLTALAGDGQVDLAWRPSSGATSYEVYRTTSPTGTPTRVTPSDFAGTSFVDTSAANGQNYDYAVLARGPDGTSGYGQVAQVTPRARTCSSGNAVARENCFPGTTAWKSPNAHSAERDGIEGFASAPSIDAGEQVDLRIEASQRNAPYHIDIYRTGYYGGSQGRLVSTIPSLHSTYQPSCFREPSTTGIVDCSSWNVSATVSTTAAWPSGVYLLKLVREDNGTFNEILLVVRDDQSHSDVVYKVPTHTYQAYNNYRGKSLYDNRSEDPITWSNGTRAVKVSIDRPYAQAGIDFFNDWYTNNDVANIGWLERQGYDVTYMADEDLGADGATARRHRVLISGSHDEYWTQQMFDGAVAARDAGTSIFFLGANAVYWKIRREASPQSGEAGRVLVTYKSVQGGPPDPGGPTSTWRDPAGPNRPENGLVGQMYAGDNSTNFFPLRVSAAEGRHRIWRYTPLADLASGTTASIGTGIVGWEWDNRVDNGREPPGVTTIASSPVQGGLIQDNGRAQAQGTTTATATVYRAASGAQVFATGTNNWWRGLGRNVWGEGEPDDRIAQATANVLADMGATPTTPVSALQLDAVGAPAVSDRTPAPDAGSVTPSSVVRVTFDRQLDPSSVEDDDLTLTDPAGDQVGGAVSYDKATRSISFRPADSLEPFTAYTARLQTDIRGWGGEELAAPSTWTFSTGTGTPPVVTTRSPAVDATGVLTDAEVSARFDRRLDPTTVDDQSFSLRPAAGGAAVAAQVAYDPATRSARLVPDARLAESTRYTATLSTALEASDGVAMTAPVSWSFTTGTNLKVTDRAPAPLAGGISPTAVVRVTFSRAADAATVTTDALRLRDDSGALVPATATYDAVARTATLRPSAPLALLTSYTVTVGGGLRASDGAPLDGATWTFTTAATTPPAPAVTAAVPAADASDVSNETTVRASFDRPLDPATVTPQTFSLAPAAGGPAVAATVTYDAAAQKATLEPLAALAIGTRYTATLTTAVSSAVGSPLSSTITWSFTTAECPCTLMASRIPQTRGLPVRDNRPAPGPWTYELGTRVSVDQPTQLVALRFFKEAGETGAHVGRVWSGSGALLRTATFQDESASGWQRQALASSLTLQPGQIYTVSVGVHEMYAKTVEGLRPPLSSGPLRSEGAGVYASAEGQYPTQSWASSNYFVDGVVRLPGRPNRTPLVTTRSPGDGASGVGVGAAVTAGFSVPLDASTVTRSSFTLRNAAAGSAPLDARVLYDDETQTVRLEPTAALDAGTAYTARLTTAIRSDDETPLPADVHWTFATVPPTPPSVTTTSPVAGATAVSSSTDITASFSEAMDASTLDAQSFTLEDAGGVRVPTSVTYDAATRTTRLQPTTPLAASTTYSAELRTTVRSAHHVALAQPVRWSFTTSACPCTLFPAALSPDLGGISTRNGRDPSGSWSLELGVKVRVTQPGRLEAIRFYKDADETGTHVGRIWSANGTLLASTTFAGESGSGWQQQALGTPLSVAPGQTYVVSVGANSTFGMTRYALSDEVGGGPLRSVADGQNGVYGDAAGSFPTNSWASANYFVDAVLR